MSTERPSKVEAETHDLSDIEPVTQEHDDEDLAVKARRANDAFLDLIVSAIDRAKALASTKAREMMEKPLDPRSAAAAKDAKDIGTLGEMVEGLARTFEDTVTEIRKYPYDEQVNLLTGYRKLLEEQVSVIDSRLHMVKRVKSI